jgi:prefoldin alpha subunit
MMEKKEIQEKYIEFQYLQQQMLELQKQVQTVTQQAAELVSSKSSLDELATIKEETEILVPVQNGIFVKGKISGVSELTVNVGSGIAVKKTIEETKKLLEGQHNELIEYRQQLITELQSVLGQAKKIEKEIIGMVG